MRDRRRAVAELLIEDGQLRMDLRARSQRNAALEDLRRLWCFALNVKFCCEGCQCFGRHLDTDCLAQRRFRLEMASQLLVDRGEPH